MRVAFETFFAILVARLNLDQADLEASVAVRCERQLAGDADAANDLLGLNVVNDAVPAADQYAIARARDFAAVPGGCRGPRPTCGGPNDRRLFGRSGIGGEYECGENGVHGSLRKRRSAGGAGFAHETK
jgi:hypothetical protein